MSYRKLNRNLSIFRLSEVFLKSSAIIAAGRKREERENASEGGKTRPSREERGARAPSASSDGSSASSSGDEGRAAIRASGDVRGAMKKRLEEGHGPS